MVRRKEHTLGWQSKLARGYWRVLKEHRGGVLGGWRIRKGFPKKEALVVIPESEFQAEKAHQQKQKDV